MDHTSKSTSRKIHTVRVNTPVIAPNTNTVACKELVVSGRKPVAPVEESMVDRLLRETRNKLLGFK